MRLFGMDNQMKLMQSFGFSEDEEIQSRMISRAIESAQKRVEGRNFEIRKNLLEYDNVMNEQRVYIYSMRDRILDISRNFSLIDELIRNVVTDYTGTFDKPQKPDYWNKDEIRKWFKYIFFADVEINISTKDYETAIDELSGKLKDIVWNRFKNVPDEIRAEGFKYVVLNILDTKWKEHLRNIDSLQEGIGLRGYAQRNPIVEYKLEAYDLFTAMRSSFMTEALSLLSRLEIHARVEQEPLPEESAIPAKVQTIHNEVGQFGGASGGKEQKPPINTKPQPIKRNIKLGRNDLCWCGSGKKYKNCHMEEDLSKQRASMSVS